MQLYEVKFDRNLEDDNYYGECHKLLIFSLFYYKDFAIIKEYGTD